MAMVGRRSGRVWKVEVALAQAVPVSLVAEARKWWVVFGERFEMGLLAVPDCGPRLSCESQFAVVVPPSLSP